MCQPLFTGKQGQRDYRKTIYGFEQTNDGTSWNYLLIKTIQLRDYIVDIKDQWMIYKKLLLTVIGDFITDTKKYIERHQKNRNIWSFAHTFNELTHIGLLKVIGSLVFFFTQEKTIGYLIRNRYILSTEPNLQQFKNVCLFLLQPLKIALSFFKKISRGGLNTLYPPPPYNRKISTSGYKKVKLWQFSIFYKKKT